MAGKKRAEEPLLQPPVPLDLLLDILARSDPRTVVRCTATSRAVREAILSQDFRRRLALRAEARRGFDQALLLGVSVLQLKIGAAVPRHHGEHRRFDPTLFLTHDHVASRDSFIVLRQRKNLAGPVAAGRPRDELRVCDSLTGETYRLPPAAIGNDGYPPALLTGDGGGRSFRLLAVDQSLRTQTFSSTDGRWGPILQTHSVSVLPCYAGEEISHPIVLGSDIIHWLRPRGDPHIVALHAGSAQATRIDLPPECLSRMNCIQHASTGLQLAASPAAKLAVLVAEILVISMWTRSETESKWIRQVVTRRQAICKQPRAVESMRFLGFGQRSGTVLLIMNAVDLVQLNVGTKDAVILSHDPEINASFDNWRLCLHEVSLPSLLQAMRPLQ